jgi:hypothetical protein
VGRRGQGAVIGNHVASHWGRVRPDARHSRIDRALRHAEPAMTTPIQEPTPGTREHFLQITTVQRWGTIQDYVDLCRAHGYFTPAFYATAIAHMERIHVRRRPRDFTWEELTTLLRRLEFR